MRIILGLTGSVATILYKKLVKELHSVGVVDVILTERVNNFIDMTYLKWVVESQGGKVYTEDDEWRWYGKGSCMTDDNLQYSTIWEKDDPVLHINLRDETSALVIAPCSANTLAKIANGICDNLLTSVARAWDRNRPLIVVPAMNTHMWNHPITGQHLASICSFSSNYKWINPQSKMLACKTEGMGAMCEIDEIVKVLKESLRWEFPLHNCTGIPIENHPGSFGVQRKHEQHTGVDLYAEDGELVYAVEDGVVVGIEPFTGPKDNSPWWNDTDCVLVEGASGVVCYGEITPDDWLKVGTHVSRGCREIGKVKRVLREGKERPDIMGHKPNMLHLELYPHKQYKPSNGFEDFLRDPTSFLLESTNKTTNVLT
jgi:phosphopantothenoylcysteine decarboxylase